MTDTVHKLSSASAAVLGTETLIFRTPGLIDLRAFTVMGFNAKPKTTNPIGFFGTGLKYAVAVLCRMGAGPVVWIGRDKYTFYTKKVDFRGKEFEQIWMRSDRWQMRGRNTELPFTTEYGKNWKPWMVFRELESNTRDENGDTFVSPDFGKDGFRIDAETPHRWHTANETLIVIQHPEMVKAYEERGQVFVDPEAHPVVFSDPSISIREGAAETMFYKGIRAKTLGKPALFTYDISNTMGLTEDRTFESEFWARHHLGAAVARCDDEATIEAILTADDEKWEHGLEIPSHVQPSEAFRRVVHRRPRGIGAGVYSYYGRYDNRPEVRTQSRWEAAKRPWRLDGDTIYDANDNELFREPSGYTGRWDLLAEELVRVGNTHTYAPKPKEDTE